MSYDSISLAQFSVVVYTEPVSQSSQIAIDLESRFEYNSEKLDESICAPLSFILDLFDYEMSQMCGTR